ncbi:MAG: homocysteine S-methyltransferase family protein [Lachnospiraceae bacterium]|nr:homocysteine S-methyltransferase family protein [Lachnospiraceae bacterium]
MTKQEFAARAAEKILILDGATGSNLTKAGMPKGVCTELWALEHPEAVIELQRRYIEAGSDIIYAPTFGANRASLKRFGLEERLAELNRELVQLSKTAAQGRVLVAGDITTIGYPVTEEGELSYENRVELYCEQISCLAEAGVDLLVGETLLGGDEAMAILDAAAMVCDLPVMCTLTIESDGSCYFGGNVIDIAASLEEMGAAAVGINCSCGPDQLECIVRNLRERVNIPVIVKPNAGLPVINEKGEAVYPMEPEVFGEHMKKLVQLGAGIVGGCCGTDERFIRELRKIV